METLFVCLSRWRSVRKGKHKTWVSSGKIHSGHEMQSHGFDSQGVHELVTRVPWMQCIKAKCQMKWFVLCVCTQQKLNYHWQKSGQFVLQSVAHILTWHPTGTWDLSACSYCLRRAAHLSSLPLSTGSYLLTGSACLQMWCDFQSSTETGEEAETAGPQRSWRCVWQCKSVFVHYITLNFSEFTSSNSSKIFLAVTDLRLPLTSSSFPRMESFLRPQDRLVFVHAWRVDVFQVIWLFCVENKMRL